MPKRVLVVEDEANIVESLSFLLRQAGFEVSVANDGPVALQMMSDVVPDLVLLDLMLPTMTGYEVLEKLRAAEATSTVPVIVLTAKGQDEVRTASLANGANLFVTKPYGNDEVLAAVRSLVPE